MSVVPSELPGGGGKRTVTLFGRQVSTDALLLAAASVGAILLLYRSGKPGASSTAPPLFTAEGNGTQLAGLPTNSLIASAPAPATDNIVLGDWTKQGSGYLYDPGGVDSVFTQGGRKFFHLMDYGSVQAYVAQGGQIYYSPAPGIFVPTTYGQAAPGTPAYGVTGNI